MNTYDFSFYKGLKFQRVAHFEYLWCRGWRTWHL